MLVIIHYYSQFIWGERSSDQNNRKNCHKDEKKDKKKKKKKKNLKCLGTDLSTVLVFFNLAPPRIESNKAPLPLLGGGAPLGGPPAGGGGGPPEGGGGGPPAGGGGTPEGGGGAGGAAGGVAVKELGRGSEVVGEREGEFAGEERVLYFFRLFRICFLLATSLSSLSFRLRDFLSPAIALLKKKRRDKMSDLKGSY